MARRLTLTPILCSLLILLCSAVGNSFDCNECYGEYTRAPEANITCVLLQTANDCYENNSALCDVSNPLIGFYQNRIRNALMARNCNIAVPTTPAMVPSTTTTMVQCPNVPLQINTQQLQIEIADMNFEGTVSSQCRSAGTAPMAHCSLFTHSHLRPFAGYHGGIQTCSLPGSWQLLRHENLIVEVEATAQNPLSRRHTQLTRVNVTFPSSGDCNTKTRSYSAYNDMPLSRTFDGNTGSQVNPNSPLQLHLSEGGSVVTLRASWLNSTIIIRQLAGFLAVTLQVTGQLAFQSEGLCTGCPWHQYVDSISYNNGLSRHCEAERGRVLSSCFSVTDFDSELLIVTNISYIDACTYTMLNQESQFVQLMMKGIAEDAELLPNHGYVPRRDDLNPITPIITPHLASLVTTPTNPVTTPTNPVTTPASLATTATTVGTTGSVSQSISQDLSVVDTVSSATFLTFNSSLAYLMLLLLATVQYLHIFNT